MAADATIRVSTKVDNSDMDSLQKEIDATEKKLQKLYEKGEKLESLGVGKQSKQWKSLKYDVAQAEMKLEDYKDKMSELQKIQTEGISDEFEKASESSKKCFKNIEKGSKKSDNLLKKLSDRIKKLAVGFFIYQQIAKAFRTMVNAMQEGFKNLAQYSSDYNSAMSGLKSQLATLKNSLAAAFEPIVSAIIPYLTKLVSYLNVATDKIGQFLSAISGKNTYNKAKNQVIDYARALKQASSSAQGALASFDQLNVQSSGTGAGGELVGANAFETAQVESNMVAFAERVKGVFEGLKNTLKPIIDKIGKNLVWLYENVLQPIGEFTIKDMLPNFFNVLASAVDMLNVAVEKMTPGLEYVWENVLKPIGEYAGEVFIEFLDNCKKMFEDVATVFDEKGDKINGIIEGLGKTIEYVWAFGFKPVFDFIIGAFFGMMEYVDDIIGDIIDILHGLTEFLIGVFTGDWERAWEGIKGIFKGLLNGIIDIYEMCVNAIIKGLNKISIKVPDWIPGVGGQQWGFTLEEMHLPRLAEGAVIPGGKPFAAILGDQRAGQTNIETPLSTMVEAFKQAMSDGGAGGEYTFVANIDGREIFRETISQDQMYRNRTGRSAFAY